MKNSFLVLFGMLLISTATQAQISPKDASSVIKSFSSLQRLVQLYREEKKLIRKSVVFGFETQKGSESIPPEVEAKAQKLKQMAQQNGCVIILPDEESLSLGEGDMQGSVTAFHFEMSGEGCPLFMSMTIQAQKVDNKIEGKFSLEYKALNDEFKKESDISEILQKGTIFVEVIPGNVTQRLILKVELSGAGVSQEFGAFNVENVMDTDFSFTFPLDIKATAVTEHIFQFKKDNIKLKRDSRIDGIFNVFEKYYSNDQEIDLPTYSHLAQGIQFIGISEEKDAPHLIPMSCQLELVEKASSTPVVAISSCLKNAASVGLYQQDLYQVNLDFQENWIEGVVVEVKSGRASILTALYEESSDFKKDLGPLEIKFTCQPVAKCPSGNP